MKPEKNLYTATKLANFLKCAHIVFNDHFEEELNLKKIETSKYESIRMQKGNEHEDNYLNTLKKEFSKVIDIKKLDLSNEQKIIKTTQSMKEGYEIIRGGWLERDNWKGELDFLIKNNDVRSNFGNYSYEVIDAKNSKMSKPEHIIQLGIYAFMLEEAQGIIPLKLKVALKDNIIDEVNTNDIYDLFLNYKKKYENFIEKKFEESIPEKKSFCNICRWADECEKIWIQKDDLNQIIGVNKLQKSKLLDLGINNVSDLSDQDENIILSGFTKSTSKKIIIQSKLQKNSKELGKDEWIINKENIKYPKRAFNLLNMPSECDLYFDMESVEDHIIPGGLEYLFGIFYIEKGEKKFIPFWSHNRKEEKGNLIKLFDFFENHLKKYPDSSIYHYNHYETAALRKLTSIHHVKIKEFDNLLRNKKFVDLLPVVRQGLYISEDSYSLKNMEIFYEFKREGDVQKADASQEYYIEWLESEENSILKEIENYNKQDCESTYELHQWLLSIKPQETDWNDETIEEIELKEWEKLNQNLKKRIKNSSINNEQVKKLLFDIVGFYRRERSLDFREYFERQKKGHDELMDDAECIGNMNLSKKYPTEGSYYLFEYEYQEQDFKIKKSDRIILANGFDDDGKNIAAGVIKKIDYLNKVVIIKSKRKSLPDTISIGKGIYYEPTKLELSTKNFINSFINNEEKYLAIIDILLKNYPRLKGIDPGKNIVDSIDSKSITSAISKLDNSYLYIQGPPGSGKTTYSANAIVKLLKDGKKIFVNANSHEAINNLLKKIEDIALEEKVEFIGFKVSGSNPEYQLNGDIIEDLKQSTPVNHCLDQIDRGEINTGCIVGGTKYFFSTFSNSADYLFIDEAGQLSLADLISIGRSSRNIVLIGDQNQLSHPIRADHPGNSGSSILDYLLEGMDTIPKNRGIFLDKTFRMNKEINEFISSNFYEGRLYCDDNAKNRSIDFKNSIINSPGINYVKMNHKNNVQTSIEEFVAISNILKNMIGLEFNNNGNKRKLKLDDFLIISPFNTQVNFLKANLENQNFLDSKVGTIDKFQGQEAPIVIISMASSDSDAIPRNKEFFFSKNRLNVAVSRAQVLSIILFNSKLLDGDPSKIETMKLMNNYFKITKYATWEQ